MISNIYPLIEFSVSVPQMRENHMKSFEAMSSGSEADEKLFSN